MKLESSNTLPEKNSKVFTKLGQEYTNFVSCDWNKSSKTIPFQSAENTRVGRTKTPLSIAVDQENLPMIELLIANGAHPVSMISTRNSSATKRDLQQQLDETIVSLDYTVFHKFCSVLSSQLYAPDFHFKPEILLALIKAYPDDVDGWKQLASDLKTVKSASAMNTYVVQQSVTILQTMMVSVSKLISMNCEPPLGPTEEAEKIAENEKQFGKNVDLKLKNAMQSLEILLKYQFYPQTIVENYDVKSAISESEYKNLVKIILMEEKRAIVNKKSEDVKTAIAKFKQYLKC